MVITVVATIRCLLAVVAMEITSALCHHLRTMQLEWNGARRPDFPVLYKPFICQIEIHFKPARFVNTLSICPNTFLCANVSFDLFCMGSGILRYSLTSKHYHTYCVRCGLQYFDNMLYYHRM